MNITNIISKQVTDRPRSFVDPDQLDLFESKDFTVTTQNTRQRWLKMATGDVDRAGDILVLAGLESTNFLKNPQFLWQHGASGALVNTIGKVLELKTTQTALFALVEYAPADTNSLAEQVFQMDLLGLLPANSIGFRPIEWEANDFGGHTFTKWELIECSKVELPMNPQAVDNTKAYSIEEAAVWLLASD
ncbi:MAG: HK97 family phage prohead protease [Bacteroidota bacterium]|nr:HK97 family phage prohead protease [Bacteroidota bacterium]MDP4231872.1 HK97 family phage prohead protease [Bacteroidota bacterium]MDP4242758.1 HK97 family phage prohead protease [Bacteroidota bacterium]MDP4287209.1 HK97 family phage prohead protease [Bacteroidota bacterium]